MSTSAATFTFCLLTPPGRGAVAAFQLSGHWTDSEQDADFPFRSASQRLPSQQPIGRIWYGRWRDEDVVLCRIDQTTWELHCHGGLAAASAVAADLTALRGRELAPAEWLRATRSPLAAEFHAALLAAPTWRTAEYLLRHPTLRWETAIADALRNLNDGGAFDWDDARRDCDALLARARFGLHLTRAWTVMLVGEPNVGKSSLLNRIAGFERAIVHHEPGTTRDLVAVSCAVEGWPMRLIDSAGIRESLEPVESLGIARALAESRNVDLVVHLRDFSQPASPEEARLAELCPGAIRIAHKSDLPRHSSRADDVESFSVSSTSGAGVDELLRRLVQRLVPETPPPDAVFPINERQVACLEELLAALQGRDVPRTRRGYERLLRGERVTGD